MIENSGGGLMTAVIVFLVVAFLYVMAMLYTRLFDSTGETTLAKHTLFVTAHPDDECMFFTPTIHAMRESSKLYLLVLSNGGYDGLGKEREKEMCLAAKHMGFVDYEVVDDKLIPDGPGKPGQKPNEIWDVEVVKKHIENYVKDKKKDGINIETIVTFDDGGVSWHPNHIATHMGCIKYYKSDQYSGDMYILETVQMFRKYNCFLDIFLSQKDRVNYYLSSPYHAITALAIHYT